jgi:hypothetical protein
VEATPAAPAATETAQPAATQPAPTQPAPPAEVAKKETPPSAPPGYAEMMQKRMEHRQKMQEQMDKIHSAKDPEERQRLMEEFEKTMQQHRQEMWSMMSPPEGRYQDQDDNMPPPFMPPYGYGPPPGYYGGGYGPGPGSRFGRGGMTGPGPRGGFMASHQAHQEAMEKHLQKIEALLEEIVKSLPKQEPAK